MKKSVFKNFYAFLAVIVTAFGGVLTSCSSNDENTPAIFYDIATLTGMGTDGCTFTLRQVNDSPLVTLTSTYQLNNQTYKVGTRYLIAYSNETNQAFVSGGITLQALGYVYNSEITTGTSESTNQWRTEQQYLLAMWRAGEWINIQTNATYDKERPTAYDLVVDETTLGNDYPEAFIIYEPDKSVNATTKLFYATFNIEEVWNRPNVKGLNVTFVGNNGPQTVKFDKSANATND